jgi:hypothetical protein
MRKLSELPNNCEDLPVYTTTIMSSHTYEFHSFHMNIGVGDGSLHILVDTATKVKKRSRGTIVKTILVDSGTGKDGPVERILRTMKWIEDGYDLPAGDSSLMLDAVIVTHWDMDHYMTLVHLVRKTIAAQPTKKDGNDKTRRVPFLRYDSNDDPVTVMYAPTWKNRKAMLIPPVINPPVKKSPGKNTPPPPVSGPSVKKWMGPWRWLLSGADKSSKKVYMKVNPEGDGERDTDAEREAWPRVFLLVHGTKNLLGRNFLTSGDIKYGWQENIKSPQELVNEVQPSPAGAPGVYCIAVNGLVLGEKKSVIVWKTGNKPIVDTPSSTKTPAARKNTISISCLVIWRNSSTEVRLSHYFAGDAVWNLEKIVVQWIGKAHVAAMKISHHGSSGSTPIGMVDALNPKSIIISAHNQHGHPSECPLQ